MLELVPRPRIFLSHEIVVLPQISTAYHTFSKRKVIKGTKVRLVLRLRIFLSQEIAVLPQLAKAYHTFCKRKVFKGTKLGEFSGSEFSCHNLPQLATACYNLPQLATDYHTFSKRKVQGYKG